MPKRRNNALTLQRILQRIFTLQAREVASKIDMDKMTVPDLTPWVNVTVEAVKPVMTDQYQTGIMQAASRLARLQTGISSHTLPTDRAFGAKKRLQRAIFKAATIEEDFDLFNPKILDAVDNHTFIFARSTLETATTDLKTAMVSLRQLMREGLEAGAAHKLLAKKIREIFSNPNRAFTIAQTESSRFTHLGQIDAAQEAGATHKTWIASSDACFGAGSLLLTYKDGKISRTPIEDVQAGDFVIGHSGLPRRVLHASNKPFSGEAVVGQGFLATSDHRFLTSSGWRPVGEYSADTKIGSLFNDLIVEPSNIPTALSKVVGLPTILSCDLGLVVPIRTVAEDNQVKGFHNEVNHPLAVHGNLLRKFNACLGQHVCHKNFNVCSLGLILKVGGVKAFFGAVEILTSLYPTWVFQQWLAAPTAVAKDFLLRPKCRHENAMCGISARSGAIRLSPSSARHPFSPIFSAAHDAFFNSVSRDAGIGLEGVGLAFPTAILRPPLNMTGWHPVRLATKIAEWIGQKFFSTSVVKSGAFDTTELPSSFEVLPSGLVSLRAKFADHCLPKDVSLARAFMGAEFLVSTFDDVPSVTKFASPVLFTPHNEPPVDDRPVKLTKPFQGLVYDIEVEKDHSFVLACGLVAHNCERCLALEGKTVRLNEPFVVTGSGPYSRVLCPPLHPNCFCTLSESMD